MKTYRFPVVLTVVNLALLVFLVVQIRPVAGASGAAPVLRGRALEIVDDQGRVRASIQVLPANPAATMPSGGTFPETVILRLIDPNGRPSVKLTESVQGAGLMLAGETDSAYLVLKAEGAESSLKLLSKENRQQIIKP